MFPLIIIFFPLLPLVSTFIAAEVSSIWNQIITDDCKWVSFFFPFWLHLGACRILVPQPGIEPGPTSSESAES